MGGPCLKQSECDGPGAASSNIGYTIPKAARVLAATSNWDSSDTTVIGMTIAVASPSRVRQATTAIRSMAVLAAA